MVSRTINYDSVEDVWNYLFQKALKYLAFKPRTKQEVITKLNGIIRNIVFEGNDFEPIIGSVISKLTELKFINDDEYVDMYIQSFLASRKAKSVGVLRSTLMKKGLDKELVDSKISIVSAEDDIERVRELALHKLKSLQKKFPDNKRKHREMLYKYLMQRGYKSSNVIGLIDTILNLK